MLWTSYPELIFHKSPLIIKKIADFWNNSTLLPVYCSSRRCGATGRPQRPPDVQEKSHVESHRKCNQSDTAFDGCHKARKNGRYRGASGGGHRAKHGRRLTIEPLPTLSSYGAGKQLGRRPWAGLLFAVCPGFHAFPGRPLLRPRPLADGN